MTGLKWITASFNFLIFLTSLTRAATEAQLGLKAPPKPGELYYMPEDIKILPDGNLLVAFGCSEMQSALGDLVAIFSKDGELVKEIHSGKCGLHTIAIMPDGSYLITEKDAGRVARISQNGETLWSFIAEGMVGFAPNDAILANNGNYLISDSVGRLLEVSPDKKIVWLYTVGEKINVHDVSELPNGNLLYCISGQNRVVEMDRVGTIVWEYAKDLDWPRNVTRLSNGHTLITDKKRCIELDANQTITWQAPIGGYNTIRTDDGFTFICTTKGIVKLNIKGEVVWNLRFRLPPDEEMITKGLTLDKIQELKMIGYIQ